MYLSWILVVIGCGETEAEKIDEPVVEDTGCNSWIGIWIRMVMALVVLLRHLPHVLR